jgi:cell wall-associated NlpC family hydrolase
MTVRADIVRVARSYVGTQFHHAARLPGVGMDCAGVVICAGRALGIWPQDFDVPPYTEQPDGTLLDLCDQHLVRISRAVMMPGDVIVLRIAEEPQHLGIVGDYRHGGLSIIHASNAKSVVPPRVIETRLMFARNQRFVAAYAFPGIA